MWYTMYVASICSPPHTRTHDFASSEASASMAPSSTSRGVDPSHSGHLRARLPAPSDRSAARHNLISTMQGNRRIVRPCGFCNDPARCLAARRSRTLDPWGPSRLQIDPQRSRISSDWCRSCAGYPLRITNLRTTSANAPSACHGMINILAGEVDIRPLMGSAAWPQTSH